VIDTHVTRAGLFLLVAPGFLAEVLSQNVPLLVYLQPATLVLGSLAYGVPVLLIRELSVARRLNPLGLCLLGLGYGILNEGVLAKTLTQASGAPLYGFAGYGQTGALQVGWTMFMVPWHALHSVLYPILLACWLFPSTASRRWFATGPGRVLLYVLVLILAALYGQYFLTAPPDAVPMFAVYAVATVALAAIALLYCVTGAAPASGEPRRPSRRPALLGGATVVFYLASFWMPGHVPFALFALVTLASIVAAATAMKRAAWRPLPDLLLFGLGDYIAFCVLAAVLAIAGGGDPWQAAAAGVIFVVLFAYLVRAVSMRPLGRGAALRPAT